MHSYTPRLPFSAVFLCSGVVAVLAVAYVGLIAVVMSYATITVEFSQSVKNNETAVASLESKYLDNVNNIHGTDYVAAGYAIPSNKIFVPVKSVTALR